MPLVFGGAPIINTMISVMEMEAVSDVSPYFFASLTIVIVGAIVTLVSAPKPGKKKTSSEEDKPLWDQTREENAANIEAVNSENEPAEEVETVITEDEPTEDEPTEDEAAKDEAAEDEAAEDEETGEEEATNPDDHSEES